jgi:hypothetical protein
MSAYLKSVDAWHIVESKWTNSDKATAKLSKDEKIASFANDKALNAIFISIFTEEFSKIS